MATVYDLIQDGIVTALTAAGSPFKQVIPYGTHLPDDDLATELDQMRSLAPSALVFYAGGESNEGYAGNLEEKATFIVLVVAAERSRAALLKGDAQGQGLFALLKHVRETLHNVPTISGINNPLLWSGNTRFVLPNHPITVAAYAVRFRADLNFADGP